MGPQERRWRVYRDAALCCRSSRRATCTADHSPPRAVGIFRWFNPAAMARQGRGATAPQAPRRPERSLSAVTTAWVPRTRNAKMDTSSSPWRRPRHAIRVSSLWPLCTSWDYAGFYNPDVYEKTKEETMKLKRTVLAFVLGTFVLLTLSSMFGATAIAQRDCGPNSQKCLKHHESCTC